LVKPTRRKSIDIKGELMSKNVILVRKNEGKYCVVKVQQDISKDSLKSLLKEQYSRKKDVEFLTEYGKIISFLESGELEVGNEQPETFEDYDDALTAVGSSWADDLFMFQNGKWYHSPLNADLKLNAF
jgi:hypothetical protein